jgi:Bacterial Ig-like domain (group 1)
VKRHGGGHGPVGATRSDQVRRRAALVAGALVTLLASSALSGALGAGPADGAAATGRSGAVPAPPPVVTLTSSSAISATRSTVVASSTSGTIGAAGITVTVTLRNASGVPVPGKLVTLTGSGDHVVVATQDDVTDSLGRAWFTVTVTATATRSESTTLTATDVTDATGLSHRPCVCFTSGPGAATPEVPVTLALPLAAAAVLGGAAFVARRRRSLGRA